MFGIELSGLGNVKKLSELDERCMTIAGHKVQEQIRRFSQEYMMSPDGTTFAPLTKKYEKRKVRAGRKGLPNFTFTGSYMRGMKPRKSGGDVLVGPESDHEPMAEGLSKKRSHIGIANETPGIIEASMKEEFERTLNV